MATEIEAKMAVQSHDPVRQRLVELEARHIRDVQETNLFFDTPDHKLQMADRGLRLRVNRDTVNGTESCILTVKGPRQPGLLKSREEAEVEVTDAGKACRFLELLGYQKHVSFQKRRQSWDLECCHVELDELPYLGRFVEIEGPSELWVMQLRERLGLSGHPIIKTGYVALLMGHLAERGILDRDVRFA